MAASPVPNFAGRVHQVIVKRCVKELERVLLAPSDAFDHHGLALNFLDLAEDDPDLADCLLKHPRMWLGEVEDLLLLHGLDAEQLSILEVLDPEYKAARAAALAAGGPEPRHARHHPKRVLHLRLTGLPYATDPAPCLLRPAISTIGAVHLTRLVVVSGTVVRTGAVKASKAAQAFTCTRCHHATLVRCRLEDGGVAPAPDECRNPLQPCPGSKFRAAADSQMFTGFQEIRVQEKSSCLAMGALPAALPVVLQDELVDRVQCGDDVEVVGVVVPRWQPMVPGQRCELDLVLVANNLTVVSKRAARVLEVHASTAAKFEAFWDAHRNSPLTGRNKILSSFCPQIHGMFLVKLAVALALCGGVARPDEHVRGDVHLLLIGDPGIGKSQIMKFASRAAHRSVVVSGRATSGAGLTAAAVKDGGTWVLEAGALVLADGGVCCIDEFDGISEGERAMMHEAMEQQTVHVAKAGMVTTLHTRTTVIASVNPKPGWKPSQPLTAATNISGPLLSRFDVLLLLLDVRHPDRDRKIASRVLDNHEQGASRVQQQQQRQQQQAAAAAAARSGTFGNGAGSQATLAVPGVTADAQAGSPNGRAEGAWPLEVLRAYLMWARTTLHPVMTREAEQVLQAYYQVMRQSEERSAARTTIRMLEALVRVAQAHARLCGRREVGRRDAIVAVALVDASQGALHLLPHDAPLASEFPSRPDDDYAVLEQRVLRELGLPYGAPAPLCGAHRSDQILMPALPPPHAPAGWGAHGAVGASTAVEAPAWPPLPAPHAAAPVPMADVGGVLQRAELPSKQHAPSFGAGPASFAQCGLHPAHTHSGAVVGLLVPAASPATAIMPAPSPNVSRVPCTVLQPAVQQAGAHSGPPRLRPVQDGTASACDALLADGPQPSPAAVAARTWRGAAATMVSLPLSDRGMYARDGSGSSSPQEAPDRGGSTRG